MYEIPLLYSKQCPKLSVLFEIWGNDTFNFANIGKLNYLQRIFKVVGICILTTTEILGITIELPKLETLVVGQKLPSSNISNNLSGITISIRYEKLARECGISEQKWRSKEIFCSDDTKNDPSNEQVMTSFYQCITEIKKIYSRHVRKVSLTSPSFRELHHDSQALLNS